uniref:uncharacterized protein LOC129523410 n=1 Tax=Nyctereutes procyonoides TaxID=34880 RepID=UPI002443C373|nr:uncharacterized protein LOC129523410 [Nyctereutes procyonoides]
MEDALQLAAMAVGPPVFSPSPPPTWDVSVRRPDPAWAAQMPGSHHRKSDVCSQRSRLGLQHQGAVHQPGASSPLGPDAGGSHAVASLSGSLSLRALVKGPYPFPGLCRTVGSSRGSESEGPRAPGVERDTWEGQSPSWKSGARFLLFSWLPGKFGPLVTCDGGWRGHPQAAALAGDVSSAPAPWAASGPWVDWSPVTDRRPGSRGLQLGAYAPRRQLPSSSGQLLVSAHRTTRFPPKICPLRGFRGALAA